MNTGKAIFFGLALIAMVAGDPATAYSQEAQKGLKTIYVEIIDDVGDGCWRSPQSAKRVVENELRSAGLELDNSLDAHAIIYVNAVGGSTLTRNGAIGCAAGYSLIVSTYAKRIKFEYQDEDISTLVSIWTDGGHRTGAGDLSRTLTTQFKQLASKLALSILKANR